MDGGGGNSPPVCRTAPTREAATARRGEVPKTVRVPEVGVVRVTSVNARTAPARKVWLSPVPGILDWSP